MSEFNFHKCAILSELSVLPKAQGKAEGAGGCIVTMPQRPIHILRHSDGPGTLQGRARTLVFTIIKILHLRCAHNKGILW